MIKLMMCLYHKRASNNFHPIYFEKANGDLHVFTLQGFPCVIYLIPREVSLTRLPAGWIAIDFKQQDSNLRSPQRC